MANVKDYNSVLMERAKDLENFLYGVCLTRVIQCSEYFSNGMFDPQVFFEHRHFVGCWNGKSDGFKLNNKNLEKYWKYRRTQNSVLGIPKEFIWKVLQPYKGKRFALEDVLVKIGGYRYKDKNGEYITVGEGRWTIVNHGQDSYTNERGDRVIKASWSKMIYLSDKKEWRELFRNSDYDRFETIQNISKRVVKILYSMESPEVEPTEEVEQPKVDSIVNTIFSDPDFAFLFNNEGEKQNEH